MSNSNSAWKQGSGESVSEVTEYQSSRVISKGKQILLPEANQQWLQRNRLLCQTKEIDFMWLCSIWITHISALSHPKLVIAPITLFHISSGNVFVVFARDQLISGVDFFRRTVRCPLFFLCFFVLFFSVDYDCWQKLFWPTLFLLTHICYCSLYDPVLEYVPPCLCTFFKRNDHILVTYMLRK